MPDPSPPASATVEGEPFDGYLFAYFTGEDKHDGEQIYFAATRSQDPRLWDTLNGGQPVLTSTHGERGLRDPFLLRASSGDRFFLLATDLRIFGSAGWRAAKRVGSLCIEVWESSDLVNWSSQRHIQVSPDTAGCTWAPKAHFDPRRGAYVVYWASRLYAEGDTDRVEETHERMLYATTRDFRTFSPPQIWHDPGHPVLDATVVLDCTTYYRFTKDARARGWSEPCGSFITQEKSTRFTGAEWELVAESVGRGDATRPGVSEGEGPTVFRSNTEQKWYLLVDEFRGRGYVPFETSDLAGGVWRHADGFLLPQGARHGSVLPITRTELERVRAHYGADNAPLGR
ncbi:glycosyl hydrolase family 43 [Kribbella pratensis]|uniref:Glycosyl hydrolase family 43 n=1 Tax=Kribbella pratensis TaxID=2512112 RepID=A0ABY2F8D5_9ACTN|nr:glycoside hydrolase family 43 protein [Kribbella pratensis]TDW84428.1 glycosyl hydrolase family 43 [Kribbella pratensis]